MEDLRPPVRLCRAYDIAIDRERWFALRPEQEYPAMLDTRMELSCAELDAMYQAKSETKT